MKQTRLEWLADRVEVLDSEVRNHESEAKWHEHMAEQKRKQLDGAYREMVAETRVMEGDPDYYENAPISVSALSTFSTDNLFTAILADIRSAK